MKTSVIEVHDMLSVLSVDEVEKRTGDVPGVESVTVNFAAGNATVRYDETRLNIADLKSAVRQRGFEPTTPDVLPATSASAAPTTAPVSVSSGTASQDTAAPAAPPASKSSSPAAAASEEPPGKAAPEKS